MEVIMKSIVLSLIVTIFSLALYSQGSTPVPGGDISGTWTLAGSPYLIMGETTVPDGETLTIEPGVLVEFQDYHKMLIQGRILAEGTANDSIIFTAKYTFDGFNSIRFLDTPLGNDTSRFAYCEFSWGRVTGIFPDNCGGAIAALNYGKFIIDHCLFAHNKAIEGSAYGGAIALWTSSPKIRNSTFTDNESKYGGAIDCYMGSEPDIHNNVFCGNKATFYGGAIFCINNSNPDILYNLLYENTAGVSGGAIDLDNNCSPDIINNTIVDNVSDSVGGGIAVYDSCNPEIRNTILWGNTADVDGNQVFIWNAECFSEGGFYYSDIEGGEEAFGGETFIGEYDDNIEEDPVFRDPPAGDYILIRDVSPCINAGDPDPIYNNPDGTRNDMGAIWPSWWHVGINDSYKSQVTSLKLTCYPNPALEILNIEYRLLNIEMVELVVIDIHGQKMKRLVNKTQSSGEYQVPFDPSGLPAGIYYVRLQAGNEVVTRKVVKL